MPNREQQRAIDAATRHYLAGRPLDMSALAQELGIGRATLYRHVGNRDELLAEVLAAATERTYRKVLAAVRSTGTGRVIELVEGVMRAVDGSSALRALTAREPLLFLRLALGPGRIEAAATAITAGVLAEEQQRGTLTLPLAPEVLASAIVRICDVHLYAPLLGGDRPEIDTAVDLVCVLLGSPR